MDRLRRRVSSRRRERATGDQVRNEWGRACRQAAVPKLRLHDLRGGFSDEAEDAGMETVDIMELAGHADLMTRAASHLTLKKM